MGRNLRRAARPDPFSPHGRIINDDKSAVYTLHRTPSEVGGLLLVTEAAVAVRSEEGRSGWGRAGVGRSTP